ncbi:MAG: zinc ABC transporter substrate-binding protein [Proteobacteria bacterium]|nr:zinc ABC transporter substrate-binding protein [Pseudomonadota bacterium]
MRRRDLMTGLLTLAAARATAARADTPPLPVVASFSILADMVREVGGPGVAVTSLVPPDGDPHEYEPKPSDLRTLAAAGLLVVNGLGLEGRMTRLADSSGFRGPVCVASQGVKPRTMTEDGGATVTDPHAWQDPRNGALYARNIAAALAKADPARSDAYRAAGERYAAAILETDAWVAQQFAPIPQARRVIVTTHDAFGYFGARYGIRVLAAEGISTDAEPSAKGIARLVAQVKREHVRAVFLENMTDPRIARALAKEAGAAVGEPVYSDALSPPDGPAPTYLSIFRHNVPLFVAAMRG